MSSTDEIRTKSAQYQAYAFQSENVINHRHGVVNSDAMILTQTKALINENQGIVPGVINLYHQLQNKGYCVDVKRLRCLLRDNGIVHRWHRKYVATTDSNHSLGVSPNLLKRQFDKF